MWRGLLALVVLGGLVMCLETGCDRSKVRYEGPAVSRSIPLDAATAVRAKIPSGQITVQGWDKATVAAEVVVWAQAHSQERAEQLAKDAQADLARAGEKIVLECKPIGQRSGEMVGAKVVLHVPAKAGPQVEAEAAPAPASAAAAGPAERKHAGVGDIKLHDCSKPIDADVGVGSIQIDRAAGTVDCTVGTGDIVLKEVRGTAKARTGTGDVKLSDIHGAVKAHTGCGDVVTAETYGPTDAAAGVGDIKITNPRDAVKAHTGVGEIRLDAGPGCWKGSPISLSTGVGEIDVSLVP